jgi:hypothetical protein
VATRWQSNDEAVPISVIAISHLAPKRHAGGIVEGADKA